MKTLTLTDEQYDLLIDIVLAERRAIVGSIDDMPEDEKHEAIKAYNLLAEMFDLEEWAEPESYTLGDLVREYIDSQNEDD